VLHTNLSVDPRFEDSANDVFDRLVIIDENVNTMMMMMMRMMMAFSCNGMQMMVIITMTVVVVRGMMEMVMR
jgi:hypothetical protein